MQHFSNLGYNFWYILSSFKKRISANRRSELSDAAAVLEYNDGPITILGGQYLPERAELSQPVERQSESQRRRFS